MVLLLLLMLLLLLFMRRRVWGFGFRVPMLGRRNRLADELRASSLLPQTRSQALKAGGGVKLVVVVVVVATAA